MTNVALRLPAERIVANLVPAGIRPQKPGDNCNRQHNERGETPPVIGHAGPPPAGQHKQRRNDRDEKEDVIEIQTES